MTMLKVVGVLVGAFLLLGLGFIEPSKNLPETGRVLLVLLGLAICVPLAIIGTYYVTHGKKVDHEEN